MGRFTKILSSNEPTGDLSHLKIENLDQPRQVGPRSRFFGTGQPQEQTTPAPLPGAVASEEDLDKQISAIAKHVGIDEAVWRSLLYQESRTKQTDDKGKTITSKAGALGIGQLMPDTAKDLGVDPHDRTQNLYGSATYFKRMLDEFGDVETALQAYNAGPGKVRNVQAGKDTFKEETQRYVPEIMSRVPDIQGHIQKREQPLTADVPAIEEMPTLAVPSEAQPQEMIMGPEGAAMAPLDPSLGRPTPAERYEKEQVQKRIDAWNNRPTMSFNQMIAKSEKVNEAPGFKDIDFDKLSAADKQGVWVLQQMQDGMPTEVIEKELMGMQEPMYGPDDLIADIATGFAYSGYRLAAKAGAKAGAKQALKGVGMDVGFGAVAGGAMTAADMATDNQLVTLVSGLLSPAGAKVFFSMSRASLKEFMKSLAQGNPEVAKNLAEAVETAPTKTKGAKEVKKTIKQQVKENVDKKITGKPEKKPEPKGTKPRKLKAPAKPTTVQDKLKAAHQQKQKKLREADEKKPAPKPKAKTLTTPPTLKSSHEAIDKGKKAGKKGAPALRKTEAEWRKKVSELEGKKDKTEKELDEQMEAATQAQFHREAAETAEGKTLQTPQERLKQQAAAKSEAQPPKKKLAPPKMKTKSFKEQEVKNALAEADVKNPKVIAETEMDGEDFLNLTTGSDTRKNAIKKLIKEKGTKKLTKYQAPILVVDKDGKVIGHDGRHRAAAAIQKGEKFKTLVVSEDEAFDPMKLSSQKFGSKDRGFTIDVPNIELPKVPEGPAPDLRAGIVGGGKLPKPETATKPRPWSKLTTPAVINRKTGEVLRSDKEIPFKPSRQKNIDAVEQEIRNLRNKMIKQGVSPNDIENGWIANDNLKFVPRTVQQAKIDVEDALKATADKQMATFDAETKAIKKQHQRTLGKLKKMAKPTAVHRLVMKANKKQAEAAASLWWKANPELRKGLDYKDIKQASEKAVWELILLTPMKDLKKYVENDKAIKALIGGKINNMAKWTARDYSKELIKQKTALGSLRQVKEALDKGELKTPLSFEEGKYAGGKSLEQKQVDDLIEGIQDPEIRDAARAGISPEELTEGMEAAAKHVSSAATMQRDLKILGGDLGGRKVFPKKGKESALGKKPLSKRARKAARKRLYKRELQLRAKGQLVKRTEAEVNQLKAREAELQAKVKEAQLKRDQAQAQKGQVVSEKGAKRQREQLELQAELEKAEKAFVHVTFRLDAKEADLAKLKAASKTLEEQGFEPLIKLSKEEAGHKAAQERMQNAAKDMATKDAEYLEKKIGELQDKGGHYLDMQTLGDIRRTAQRLGDNALVKEVETIMMKEQQRLEIRNKAKEAKSAGQTTLYSGLPIWAIKKQLLDPLTNSWTRAVDKLGGKAAKLLRTNTLKSGLMTHVASGLIEDFGLTKAYRMIRREFELDVHRWETVAGSHAEAIQKINGDFASATRRTTVSKKAAQLRAMQIAGGSLTAFGEKFEAVKKASRRFKRLEDMLTERGLLKDHQFKRLSRAERAKAMRYLDNVPSKKHPNPGIKQRFESTMEQLQALKETDPRYKLKTRELTNKLYALENERIELTTRLQIHYKNSGKNYFRLLVNKMKRQEGQMNRFKNMKMQKRWAIRRDNWQVDLKDDGSVVVSVKGKPLKNKKLNLSKMINKGISEEAKDAFLYDLFGRIERSGRWTTGKKKPGYAMMPKDQDAWGPLAGKYVQIPVYRELMNTHKEIGKWEKALRHSMSAWKAGKVVWSPRAQFRNFMSNIILGDILADINVSTALPRHINNIVQLGMLKQSGKTDNEILKAFKLDTTLMKSSFAQNEIADAMRWLDPTKLTTPGSAMDQIGELFNKAMMTPSKIYSLIEEGMKLTIFKDVINKGLKGFGVKNLSDLNRVRRNRLIRHAEDKANYALFDYSKVPPVIRWARHGYSPFITFTYKAIPRLAKEFTRKPWKAAKWFGGLYVLQKVFNEMSGDSEEEIRAERRVLPHYAQRDMLPGQPSHLRLPWKDEDGRAGYFDLSFIVPWGDITEGTGDLSMGSRSIMPNNPVWNLWRDFSANEDVFLEQPLTYKHDTGGEVAIKYMKHAWKAVAPGIVDPNSLIKIKRVMFNEKDYKGRDYSTAEAIFDAFMGLKIRRFEYMEEAARRFKELGEVESDMKLEFIREWNRINIKQNLTPEEQREEMEQLFLNLAVDSQKLIDHGFYLLNADDDK